MLQAIDLDDEQAQLRDELQGDHLARPSARSW